MTAMLEKTRDRVKQLREKTDRAVQEIVSCGIELKEIQTTCEHDWKFVTQFNDYDPRMWSVTYRCTACELTKDVRKPPVCSSCDTPLVRAKKNDREATAKADEYERQGFGNPPLAFRCPKCKKLHVLWHSGD